MDAGMPRGNRQVEVVDLKINFAYKAPKFQMGNELA